MTTTTPPSGPLPFGGDHAQWRDALRYVARTAPSRTGPLVVTERTEWGWMRWQTPDDRPDVGLGDAALTGSGVYAPGWTSGWRRALLRSLWDRPRPDSPLDVTAGQCVAMMVVFFSGLIGLGPHLRGSTAITVPAALALLVAIGVPAVARLLTRSRFRRRPPVGPLAEVLAARHTLAAATAVYGTTEVHEGEVQEAEDLAHLLLWHAFAPDLSTTARAALAEAARQLAASACRVGDHTQLLARRRPLVRTGAVTCPFSRHTGVSTDPASCDGTDTPQPQVTCGTGVYPGHDAA